MDDPMLKACDEHIAAAGIDTGKSGWRTGLAQPPELPFASDKTYYWNLETNKGPIKVKLRADVAPMHASSTVFLSRLGFYDGLSFHRVIPGFMAQGGGYTPGLDPRETMTTTNAEGSKEKVPVPTIPNESGNGMTNVRGTMAMARTGDPHSANAQFFINVADNARLDPAKAPFNGRWGYTVFGQVIEGMDVVDAIVNSKTGPAGRFQKDVPVIPVIINKVSRITYE